VDDSRRHDAQTSEAHPGWQHLHLAIAPRRHDATTSTPACSTFVWQVV